MSRFNVSQGTASSFEIKSFIFYILLLVVSIPALSISVASSHLLIGGVGILWGLFGLHRFIPLTATSSATPKRSQGQSGILSLPLRLLYRFSAQEDATRQLIKRRFAKTDMIFIIFLTFSYLTWNVYCSLSPNHFSSLSTLWSQQDLFFSANTPSLFHLQNFMMSFIQVIILLMAGASAVSFVHSRQLTHIFLKLVTPFLLIGFVSALSFSPTADKVVGLDIELLKGIG
ncbi:MAG: hypothetical protein MRY79_02745 [Alphaproteobacteria bacterium]|nr:hypothetical protein [Alphaproteobacteria bacterium]